MQSVNIYAQLPVLIVVISLVYAGTRYDEWTSILGEAFRWGGRMALFLASIGLALYLLAEYGVVILWIGLVVLSGVPESVVWTMNSRESARASDAVARIRMRIPMGVSFI